MNDRVRVELERARGEVRRGDAAVLRDEVAAQRDRVADGRDAAAGRADAALLALHPGNAALRALIAANGEARDLVLADRRRAAVDRRLAAEDRLTAIAGQREIRLDVQRAQLDDASGVLASELGFGALAGELDRCRRSDIPLMLAYVSIASSNAFRDDAGALMRSTVRVIREKLRSYDPVVRIDDRTFLCAMPGTQLDAALDRIAEIRACVAHGHPPGTVTAGFAHYRLGDTLDLLFDRARADLARAGQA